MNSTVFMQLANSLRTAEHGGKGFPTFGLGFLRNRNETSLSENLFPVIYFFSVAFNKQTDQASS